MLSATTNLLNDSAHRAAMFQCCPYPNNPRQRRWRRPTRTQIYQPPPGGLTSGQLVNDGLFAGHRSEAKRQTRLCVIVHFGQKLLFELLICVPEEHKSEIVTTKQPSLPLKIEFSTSTRTHRNTHTCVYREGETHFGLKVGIYSRGQRNGHFYWGKR